jgi:hypothetical protein
MFDMPNTSTKDNQLYEVILELGSIGDFIGGIPLDYLHKEVKRRGLYSWSVAVKSALKRLENKGMIEVIDFHIRLPKKPQSIVVEPAISKFDQFAQEVRGAENGA